MSEPSKIDVLLEEIITLPSQPTTLARITDLMSDPDCSLAAVGKVVSADPAIAIKALRLVNSAHYSLPNQIVSIEHAVMLLGLKVIRNLVLSATVFETFKKGADELLVHCVACGVAMRVLVETCASDMPLLAQDAFVYGLLHDIGKIIFLEYLPRETALVEAKCKMGHMPSYEAEQEILGCDHAELGARLALSWKLPDSLMWAISGHHDISRCPNPFAQRIAALLSVADFICSNCGLVSVWDTGLIDLDKQVWAASGVTSKLAPKLVGGFIKCLPEVRELTEIAR